MGGWKESGLGSRHGADGIRKYTKRQSLLITPGYAPPRELNWFPYIGEVTSQVSDTLAALVVSPVFDDAQRATLAALCDTWIPSLEPPQGEGDPTGFWARSASDYSVADGDRDRAPAVRSSRRAAGRPARPARRARRRGDGRRRLPSEAGGDRPRVHGGPGGRRSASMPCAGSACRSTTRFPDLATGINPNWPGMGYPGPQALPKPADQVERPIKPIVPDSEELTLDADVVVVGSGAGGGVIAGELAAAGKKVCVLEMGGYHDESEFNGLELLGLPEHLPQPGAVRDRGGTGLDPGRLGARRRHGRSTGRIACGPPTRSAASGPSTVSRASTAPITTPTWTRSGSGSA